MDSPSEIVARLRDGLDVSAWCGGRYEANGKFCCRKCGIDTKPHLRLEAAATIEQLQRLQVRLTSMTSRCVDEEERAEAAEVALAQAQKEVIASLRSQLAALRAEREWRDIKTAPKVSSESGEADILRCDFASVIDLLNSEIRAVGGIDDAQVPCLDREWIKRGIRHLTDAWAARERRAQARAERDEALALVSEQANDEGLWFRPKYATEDYLQRALRRLHSVVEGKHGPSPARIDSGWQPIETAPKDGSNFIAWDERIGQLLFTAHWDEASGRIYTDNELWSESATHWQPLPAPPTLGGEPTGKEQGR